MLRALLLLACTAKVAAFAQAPAGEPGCVDLDPEVIQSAYAQAIQGAEVEAGTPTITSCADMASNGGCADEELAASCCASCALPQRMTYARRRRPVVVIVIRDSSGGDGSDDGSRI